MKINVLLYPLAVGAILTLAACGDAPDNTVSVERQPDGSATVQVQVPEQLANPDQTLDNLRQGAADMTDEAKVQALRAARAAAENASRLIGQSDAEVKAAGDDAERSAREAMGMPAL
jgi:hypothetical protein